MSTLLNFLIGFLTTAIVVLAVIWVFNRFVGDVSLVGKGDLASSTGVSALRPQAAAR